MNAAESNELLAELGYSQLLRAQLRTSLFKPCVWYGTRDSKQYVLKGPMWSNVMNNELNGALESQTLKDLLGIPSSNAREEDDYLVQDCLIDYTRLPTEIQSSRWDKGILVPRYHHLSGWSHELMGDPETSDALRLSLFEALLFRKIVGTNDTCTHNLVVLMHENRVYSIDDAALGKRPLFMWKKALPAADAAAYRAHLARLWHPLQETALRWRRILESRPDWSLSQFALRSLVKLMVSPQAWKF